MLEIINGSCYHDMIIYGIGNLEKNCSVVNDLNVFPVPDGDTGTNMVMTIKNGLHSIKQSDDIGSVAESFANGAVFGARGNSGVIISQFFKGMAQGLKNLQFADCKGFVNALRIGCRFAYSSVANPTEGTVLTVLKEATESLSAELENIKNVEDLISHFLEAARDALENTPNLLPILQRAGVVDSGGAGIVYFFEGIQKYLNGEELTVVEKYEKDSGGEYTDYSVFNKNSSFEYGYCTELLVQITVDEFDYNGFLKELSDMGDSIVTSFDDYKVKIHVHTKNPENVLAFCHNYGEFLSLKIENMSVQHTNVSKITRSKNQSEGEFSVVAVAPNKIICDMLLEMGADVVITSKDAPSSKDFIEAFEQAGSKNILLFPNSSNSIMSGIQASKLFLDGKVHVINCKSVAECYCSLPIIDFNDSVESAVESMNDTIENVYTVSVVRAEKDITFGDKSVKKEDYFAFAGEEIIAVGNNFEEAVFNTVDCVFKTKACSVVNMFYGKSITDGQISELTEKLEDAYFSVDWTSVYTDVEIIDLVLSFE